MRYGFTDGGFVVVDDAKEIGEFTYLSSPRWKLACRDPEKAAQQMLAEAWHHAPPAIKADRYHRCCENLATATRWPKRLTEEKK